MTPAMAAYMAAFGVLIILIAWLPMFLRRLPLSLPIICVCLGAAVGSLIPEAHLSLFYNSPLAEQLAEGALVMALLGSGLKIDRKFTIRGWMTAWRLLGVGMPLTIAVVAVAAWWLGGWAPATALLFGAMLAPTDPVLASDVSVGPPGVGEEGEIRFGLTAEAAMNDGLAFPFVALALLLAAKGTGAVTVFWVVHQFLFNVIGGLGVGWLLGRFFGWLLFKFPRAPLSNTGDGIVAIGIAVIVFSACEVGGLNGFLGVFATAFGMRAACPEAKFHRHMTGFTGQLEQLFTFLLLVALGASIGTGLLSHLRWADAGLGLLLIFVLRPAVGWLSLWGSPYPPLSRGLTAFFGIRGIGTLYYLLYALQRGDFADKGEIAATVGFVVLCSIVVHGAAATPLMSRADAVREAHQREREQRRQNEEDTPATATADVSRG